MSAIAPNAAIPPPQPAAARAPRRRPWARSARLLLVWGLLAALLAEDTKPETLRKMLASFLEIQPASPAPAAAPAAAPAKAPEPPAPVSESVSARNLAGSLPD